MITEVKDQDLAAAGYIHSKAWKESHKSICSAEFVETHTPQAQMEYLRGQLEAGKTVYMLVEEEPVGIVSVHGNVIENLYVLPEKQNRGFGTRLLRYAMERCSGVPSLWILNVNEGARRFYVRNGFQETGNRRQLNAGLFELELIRRV